jgi:hypothetical protein
LNLPGSAAGIRPKKGPDFFFFAFYFLLAENLVNLIITPYPD